MSQASTKSIFDTRLAFAMISNIERVMCLEILARCRKRISKMVNFELSLERENDVFRLIMSVGKFLSPYEE